MKMKELLEEVNKELVDQRSLDAKEMLKVKQKQVNSAKKTLKELESDLAELLETEVDDLELDDYEY